MSSNYPPDYNIGTKPDDDACGHLMDNFELNYETGEMECRICTDCENQEPADFSGASDELGYAPER